MARKSITKVCTRTGFTVTGTEAKIAESFYRDKSQKDGFSPWCKDAERAYNRAYRDALKASGSQRKGDANDEGVVAFDNVMVNAKQRTGRKAGRVVRKVDNTRTSTAKKRTVARKRARASKASA